MRKSMDISINLKNLKIVNKPKYLFNKIKLTMTKAQITAHDNKNTPSTSDHRNGSKTIPN